MADQATTKKAHIQQKVESYFKDQSALSGQRNSMIDFKCGHSYLMNMYQLRKLEPADIQSRKAIEAIRQKAIEQNLIKMPPDQ